MKANLRDKDKIYDLEIHFAKLKYLEKLKEQFQNTTDAALVFHLAISIYFIKFYDFPLYFTGKLVPEVLHQLQIHLEKETFEFLSNLQKNIIAQRKTMMKLDDEILKLKHMLK